MGDDAPNEVDLDPRGAAELIERGAELIDVRRPVEFEGGRLANARNVEMNELAAAAGSIPSDRPVLFYCRTGNRSAMATQAFREAGYAAFNLAGGIEAWAAAGLPLDPADGEVRTPPPAA